MRSAIDVAKVWMRNKHVIDEWMADYGARTGKSREEIVADRKGHWVHDESAEKVAVIDGFELSACPIGGGEWRYTVVTPWDASEGLCDLDERDDTSATSFLGDVIAETSRVVPEDEPKPVVREKTPPQAPESTGEASKDSPKPVKEQRRGRPKGSRDSKPRKRRTKAEIASKEDGKAKRRTSTRKDGLVPYEKHVAWVPDGNGGYKCHEILLGGLLPQIIVAGKPTAIPSDAIVWPKGKKPRFDLFAMRKSG